MNEKQMFGVWKPLLVSEEPRKVRMWRMGTMMSLALDAIVLHAFPPLPMWAGHQNHSLEALLSSPGQRLTMGTSPLRAKPLKRA